MASRRMRSRGRNVGLRNANAMAFSGGVLGRPRKVSVKTRPSRALTAMKGLSPERRAIIVVGFGDQLDDAEYLSFTIPDAHDLVHMLQHALDDPIPHLGASPA